MRPLQVHVFYQIKIAVFCQDRVRFADYAWNMFLVDYLFPKRCVSCQKWGAYICDRCSKDIQVFGFPICPLCDRPTVNGRTHDVCQMPFCLDGFIPIAQYAEPVSSLVKKIKYARVFDAGSEVFRLFKYHWPSYAPQFDMLIPLPLHPKKLQARGFNQSEMIARTIAKSRRFTVVTDILVKVRETTPQASLQLADRKANLQQGFVCLKKSAVKGKIIGVVDDVATTRTTLQLAGEVLKRADAREVWGVVLAHSF
jgi:ComF family protein